MGMKITMGSFGSLKAMVRNDAEKATSAALRAMRKEAAVIIEIAKMYAPVDEHRLEDAIFMSHHKVGNQRTEIWIMVGGMVRGRDVSDYAAVMHESVYKLGEKSMAKARSLGKPVGRKFLERALADRETEVVQMMQKAARDAL